MNQNLYQAGVKLLNAMSNHSDIVMEAYFSGAINEANFSPKVIANLVDSKVLWRPEEDAQLRLRPSLRKLLEESLQDESNRQLDANIGSALASIKTKVEHYKESLNEQRHHESESHLADLTETVYGICESLTTNVRLLWGRINNEFGYVASVDAKIRENELAQSQVAELLTQLEMFSFDELSELAARNRQLRHLLVVTLQAKFADCAKELSLVQARLLDLLGRFREFRGRTRLLKGFKLHMEQKPDFEPVNYATLSQVKDLFNQADAVIKPACADVQDVENEAVLMQLVSQIRSYRQVQTKQVRETNKVVIEEQDSVNILDNKLKKQVEAYFCEIIDTGKSMSALDYHQSQALEFDPEVWIYQVLGDYQGLPDAEREYFAIDTEGEYHPQYTGNFIIRDVQLGLR